MTGTYKKSDQIENISARWEKVSHLYGGTETMREQGKLYLPQEPDETDASYASRLHRSVLFNKFKKTIETSVGKVFTHPILVESLPVAMEEDMADIDAEGSTFNVFSKRLCTKVLQYGVSYIVVDYPLNVGSDASPYWVQVNPLSVLDVQVEFINGVETLVRFEFVEEAVQSVVGSYTGSSSATTTQRKILYLTEQLEPAYVVLDNSNNVTSEGMILNGAGLPMSRIPVVPCYGEKVSPYVGTPVLMDLAELNIAHWQDYSDVRNINHITSVPMLLLKGQQEQYDENGQPRKITISPNSVITITDPTGDAKWIEHSGESIGTNLEMLRHLEDKMSVMGLELTADRPTNETATGRTIDAAEANSKLKCIALDLESSLEAAIHLHAEYLGILDANTQVLINVSFSAVLDTADLATILNLYRDGIVSADVVLEEAKKRAIISSDATQPTNTPPRGEGQET